MLEAITLIGAIVGLATGVKTPKAQYQQMLFRFAPDRRPIELLPPPALCECRHRGLARRLVAVRRAADVAYLSGMISFDNLRSG